MSDFSSEEWRRLHTNNNENNKNEQPTKVDPDQTYTHTHRRCNFDGSLNRNDLDAVCECVFFLPNVDMNQ